MKNNQVLKYLCPLSVYIYIYIYIYTSALRLLALRGLYLCALVSLKMAALIPKFIAEEDEENSLGRERVFRNRRDPLDCFDGFRF